VCVRFCFFFPAEDGIRDATVTGVQTCALPISPGVRAGAIPLGGLTSEPARAKLEATFARAIRVTHGTRRWWASPQRLGAGAAIDSTVSTALGAQPGAHVDLHARWSGSSVRKFVDAVAKSFDRKPVDAQLVRVGVGGPVLRQA